MKKAATAKHKSSGKDAVNTNAEEVNAVVLKRDQHTTVGERMVKVDASYDRNAERKCCSRSTND